MTSFKPHQSACLRNLDSRIKSLTGKRRSPEEDRKLCDGYREIIRLYHQVASGDPKMDTDEERLLGHLAFQAMTHLGGAGDLGSVSLKDYQHEHYGPYLGVSDEGSAAGVIRQAALGSPKAVAFKTNNPMIVGVAVDAERLGGVGETAVGPEEYIRVRLECAGRILSSTNVGTRVNLRFYRRHPVVKIAKGIIEGAIKLAKKDIRAAFEPFLRAPGGRPRPLTVFVEFERGTRINAASRIFLLKELSKYAEREDVADRSVHRLGYQVRIGSGQKGRDEAIKAIDIARAAGIQDVAVNGRVRRGADEHISYPGLLNYLAPGMLGPVLRYANKRRIQICPVNRVDPETVARHVWSSLHAARQMGYELGKYGLFPLTLEESEAVIGKIQDWFSDWAAAPVFFVDQGLVSATRVDTHGDLLRGLKTWLRMVARHRVPIVLVDTVDKSKNQPLLRLPGEPKGFMTVRNLADMDRLARSLRIRVLWAGGITLPQVFALGRLGVFGIYVTTAASSPAPVPPEYATDPWLAAVKEPTFEGVLHTKLLLEAGFLSTRLHNHKENGRIKDAALGLIKALQSKDERTVSEHQKIVADLIINAWHRFRCRNVRPDHKNSSLKRNQQDRRKK
jgi:hypothetical protein